MSDENKEEKPKQEADESKTPHDRILSPNLHELFPDIYPFPNPQDCPIIESPPQKTPLLSSNEPTKPTRQV